MEKKRSGKKDKTKKAGFIEENMNLSQIFKIVLGFSEEELKSGNKNVDNLTNKFALRHYFRMAEEIKCYLKGADDAATVLDWGCGYGHMSFLMSSLGLKVISCDIHQLAVSAYRKMNLDMKNFVQIPFVGLPFKDESFELVLSCGVLEHVANEQKSLNEIWRIIKKRGFLCIYMLPNKYGLYEFINTLLKKSDHPVKYTVASIKKILIKQGFKIIEIKKSNMFPKNIPSFLPRLMQKFVKKIYDKFYPVLFFTESFLSRIPFINFSAGTIEVIAIKP